MRRKIIRFCHGLLTAAELLLLIAALLYAGYSLWDNRQVYDQVENVTKDLREIKSLSGDDPLSMFDQLRFINPDVHAWITMEGTAIDYPVLKGRTNFTYINTDVYGNFALLGSIFMDFRNSADFSDLYTVLLGHDMTGHRMFSDVNLYKDEAFFRQHTTGTLTLPDGEHPLLSLTCMVTSAGNSLIFNPQNWNHLTPEQIYESVREGAMHVNRKGLRILKAMLDEGKDVHIVALSTCSSEYSDARTILLTLMDPESAKVNIYPAFVLSAGECLE